MMRSKFRMLVSVAALTLFSTTARAADPGALCEASQLKATAGYLSCALGAASKAAKSGGTPDYSSCNLSKVAAAEAKAGAGVCPNKTGLVELQTKLDQYVAGVATALAGDDSSFGRFVDNGDGTITDNESGLVWEKKSDNGDIHDKDNFYSWSANSNYNPDGTAYTVFLAGLNSSNFAGYNDWRLPNLEEMKTLLSASSKPEDPYTYSIFKDGKVQGCSVSSLACSWTRSGYYWSSTTDQNNPTGAWGVFFGGGYVGFDGKTDSYAVRAVRAGS